MSLTSKVLFAAIALTLLDIRFAEAEQLTIAEGNPTYFEQALNSDKCDEGTCAAVTDYKKYIEKLMKEGSESEKMDLLQFLHIRIFRVKKNRRDEGAKSVITAAFAGMLPQLSTFSTTNQEKVISSLSVWMGNDSSGCNSGTICPGAFMLKDKLDTNMDCSGLQNIYAAYIKRGKETDQTVKFNSKGNPPAVNFMAGRGYLIEKMKAKGCDQPSTGAPADSGTQGTEKKKEGMR